MTTRLNKCPQCGASVIQTNLGGGATDDYCEECGWPDENRTETKARIPKWAREAAKEYVITIWAPSTRTFRAGEKVRLAGIIARHYMRAK